MNAVLQACVHCHDIDSALRVFSEMSKPEGCGVDDVTYGTLLKVLKPPVRMPVNIVIEFMELRIMFVII